MPWSLVSLVNHRPGTYDRVDTDNVASPLAGGVLDAVPSASGPPRPTNRSFVLSVCLNLAPEKRSRAAADMGRTGIPSEPLQPNAGTVPNDSSDMVRIASPRFGEIISGIRCQHAHCDIVHWVGSDPKTAGGIKPPASEIPSEDSAPNYLGCTLSLMSAERISEALRPLFLESNGSGMGQIPQPFS